MKPWLSLAGTHVSEGVFHPHTSRHTPPSQPTCRTNYKQPTQQALERQAPDSKQWLSRPRGGEDDGESDQRYQLGYVFNVWLHWKAGRTASNTARCEESMSRGVPCTLYSPHLRTQTHETVRNLHILSYLLTGGGLRAPASLLRSNHDLEVCVCCWHVCYILMTCMQILYYFLHVFKRDGNVIILISLF